MTSGLIPESVTSRSRSEVKCSENFVTATTWEPGWSRILINAISGSTGRLKGSIYCCQYFYTLTETSKDFLLQPHSSIHNNLFCAFKRYHAHPHTHTLMVQFGIQYLAFRSVDDSLFFLSNMHPASTCILLTNKLCRMYRASCQKGLDRPCLIVTV